MQNVFKLKARVAVGLPFLKAVGKYSPLAFTYSRRLHILRMWPQVLWHSL